MPYERPTFAQIRDRILADIDSELEGGDYEAGIVEYALACAIAGVCLMLYSRIETAARNATPDRPESLAMLKWASFWGIVRKSPSPNKGFAVWPAAPGSILPAGTVVRLQDGTEYTTDGADTEDGGVVSAFLTAVVPGVAGRAPAGTRITLGSPVAGVTPQGTVTAAPGLPGLTGGTDSETDRSMHARLLERIRRPPRGGGDGDYRMWALEVPGVTRAWEYNPHTTPALSPGSVHVYFVCDDEADPIPGPSKIAEVQAYIDARRPVTVPDFQALAPTPIELDVAGSIVIEAGYVQANVEAAATENVKAFIRREAIPGGTISLSRLSEVISTTAGEQSHELTDPTGDTVPADFELIVPGTINWS